MLGLNVVVAAFWSGLSPDSERYRAVHVAEFEVRSGPTGATDMTDDPQELAAELLAHLEATEELPLPDRTHRWLGEAHAATADAVGADVPEAVVRKRAEQVVELLGHVEETGELEADEHVVAAREVAREIVEQE
jgi:hypothetical protein